MYISMFIQVIHMRQFYKRRQNVHVGVDVKHRKRSFSSACSKDELQICVHLETPKEAEHGYQRAVDGDADVRTHDVHILEPCE